MLENDFSRITEENVFKYVLGKEENCLELLQAMHPKLNLQSVKVVAGRIGASNTSFNWNQLNALARDAQDNAYNIKLNIFNNQEKFMHYMRGVNSLTWQPVDPHVQVKQTYIICLCNFDPFGRGHVLYEFEAMDTEAKDDSVHIQVFNSKGS